MLGFRDRAQPSPALGDAGRRVPLRNGDVRLMIFQFFAAGIAAIFFVASLREDYGPALQCFRRQLPLPLLVVGLAFLMGRSPAISRANSRTRRHP